MTKGRASSNTEETTRSGWGPRSAARTGHSVPGGTAGSHCPVGIGVPPRVIRRRLQHVRSGRAARATDFPANRRIRPRRREARRRGWCGFPGANSRWARTTPDMNDVGMKATDGRAADPSRLRRRLLDGHDRGHQRAVRAFVKATGYVTVAERKPRAEDFPGAPPENLVAGSVVFTPPDHPVPLDDHFQWWTYVKGANWRHPLGPESDLNGKDRLSGRARCLRGRRGLREVGRQAAADRSGVGVRRARRAGAASRSSGATSSPPAASGWPTRFRATSRIENTARTATSASRRSRSSAERLRPVRHGRQRLAVDAATGIAPTTTPPRGAGGVARNPQGPDTASTHPSPREEKAHRGGSFLCTDQYCSRYMVGTRGKGEVSTGQPPRLPLREIRVGPLNDEGSARACSSDDDHTCATHGVDHRSHGEPNCRRASAQGSLGSWLDEPKLASFNTPGSVIPMAPPIEGGDQSALQRNGAPTAKRRKNTQVRGSGLDAASARSQGGWQILGDPGHGCLRWDVPTPASSGFMSAVCLPGTLFTTTDRQPHRWRRDRVVLQGNGRLIAEYPQEIRPPIRCVVRRGQPRSGSKIAGERPVLRPVSASTTKR